MTSTPAPSAIDVRAAFLDRLQAIDRARLSINGTFTRGDSSGTMSGSISFDGADSEQSLTTSVAGAPGSTVLTIVKGDLGYTSRDDGPWVTDSAPPTRDLQGVLRSVSDVSDGGPVVGAGRPLRRLEVPSANTPGVTALGFGGPLAAQAITALAFQVDEEGAPVAMTATMSWTEAADGLRVPVSQTIDYVFEQFGGSVAVTAPEHPWRWFSSGRYQLRVAYPDGWQATTQYDDADYFGIAPDFEDEWVYVLRERQATPLSLERQVDAYVADYLEDYGNPIRESISLAGSDAVLLTYPPYPGRSGSMIFAMDVVTVRAGYWYEVTWVGPIGQEARSRAFFDDLLSTFAFEE